MTARPITRLSGRAVWLPADDLDTDRLLPARFMQCLTFDGLGDHLLEDDRRQARAAGRPHPLDDPRWSGATLLVAGRNFGCGSSREHAPQAIQRAGFQAVLAGSFAGIFQGNALQIGLPCVVLAPEHLARLADALQADPATVWTLDLSEGVLHGPGWRAPLLLAPETRQALVGGRWDPLDDLLEGVPQVDQVLAPLPCPAPPPVPAPTVT